MALALAGTADQAEGREDAPLPVTLYLQIGMGDARLAPISSQAQGVASGMFAGAGVLINWRSGRPKLHPAEKPILIDITTNTPAAFHCGAMAYAQLFGGAHIRVFYDRVEGHRGPRATIALLAHVLVHEITHILQDIDRHSEQGSLFSACPFPNRGSRTAMANGFIHCQPLRHIEFIGNDKIDIVFALSNNDSLC